MKMEGSASFFPRKIHFCMSMHDESVKDEVIKILRDGISFTTESL